MYKVSEKYKNNIYNPSMQSVINIYIDGELLNPKYLLDFKNGCEIFEEELQLGSVPSQYIEMKIHKLSGIKNPKNIKIEYGILINNALTVEELSKILIGDLNNLQIKSLWNNDKSFEIIPIGKYTVDDYVDNDGDTFTIKALDNIILLNKDDGYYDASELIAEKGYATLGELAQDICDKKGLELETSSFLNSDKKIAVYDNQLKARGYMSYIGEASGNFCCATRTGKICFRQLGQDEVEIPLKLFKTYDIGEEYKISGVAYEDGVRSFKFGDKTRNTLWIRQENLFIVDEEQIENIFNKLEGLTINSFEGTVIIDPAIDIGDKIISDGKPIIYQGEMTLSKRFIADIKSKISIKQKQETTTKKESQKVINRKVQSEINQIDGKILQLTQESTEHEEKINTIENNTNELILRAEKNTDLMSLAEGNELTVDALDDRAEIKVLGNTNHTKYIDMNRIVNNYDILPIENGIKLKNDSEEEMDFKTDIDYASIKSNTKYLLTANLGEHTCTELKITLYIGYQPNIQTVELDLMQNNSILIDVEDRSAFSLWFYMDKGYADITGISFKSIEGLEKINLDVLQDKLTNKYTIPTQIPLYRLGNIADEINSEGIIKKIEINTEATSIEEILTLKTTQEKINLTDIQKEILEKIKTFKGENKVSITGNLEPSQFIFKYYENTDDKKIQQDIAEIKVKNDEISLEVSKKVGEDEVISKINQSAETVGINANKIELSANDILNLLAGNEINISSHNISIKSDVLYIDKYGNITLNSKDGTPVLRIKDYTGDEMEIYPSNFNMVYKYFENTISTYIQKGGLYIESSNGNYIDLNADSGYIEVKTNGQVKKITGESIL